MSDPRPGIAPKPMPNLPDPAQTREAAVAAQRAATGETVTIVSKTPNGLELHLDRFVTKVDPVNGREYQIAEELPNTQVYLNGTAVNLAEVQQGNLPAHRIVSGFALTPDVPKDWWEAWFEQNKNTALVQNGVVFAAKTAAEGSSEARKRASIKSGFEPLDPANLPSTMRGMKLRGGTVSGVSTGTTGNTDVDNL